MEEILDNGFWFHKQQARGDKTLSRSCAFAKTDPKSCFFNKKPFAGQKPPYSCPLQSNKHFKKARVRYTSDVKDLLPLSLLKVQHEEHHRVVSRSSNGKKGGKN